MHGEIQQAFQSSDPAVLRKLASHQSHFVRARVAGNPNISEGTHRKLLSDPQRGVVLWALCNTRITRKHFVLVYERTMQTGYCPVVCPVLAGSRFATIPELRSLLSFRTWAVDLAVVNNHRGRNFETFTQLISSLLPSPEKKSREWDEIEKRAYFHTYGTWFRPDSD